MHFFSYTAVKQVALPLLLLCNHVMSRQGVGSERTDPSNDRGRKQPAFISRDLKGREGNLDQVPRCPRFHRHKELMWSPGLDVPEALSNNETEAVGNRIPTPREKTRPQRREVGKYPRLFSDLESDAQSALDRRQLAKRSHPGSGSELDPRVPLTTEHTLQDTDLELDPDPDPDPAPGPKVLRRGKRPHSEDDPDPDPDSATVRKRPHPGEPSISALNRGDRAREQDPGWRVLPDWHPRREHHAWRVSRIYAEDSLRSVAKNVYDYIDGLYDGSTNSLRREDGSVSLQSDINVSDDPSRPAYDYARVWYELTRWPPYRRKGRNPKNWLMPGSGSVPKHFFRSIFDYGNSYGAVYIRVNKNDMWPSEYQTEEREYWEYRAMFVTVSQLGENVAVDRQEQETAETVAKHEDTGPHESGLREGASDEGMEL
ncbi:MAG: hypothetical protein M1837_002249 [Sclerophora amabilis]|nr:MAG: hypothetical protein M1837_002249 [Sclerophora amabilis]